MSDLSKAGDWFRQHLLSDEQKAWLEQAQRDHEIAEGCREFDVALTAEYGSALPPMPDYLGFCIDRLRELVRESG